MPFDMKVVLSPVDLVLRWGPSPLPKKVVEPPIFSPSLLRQNGCMDQNATWYGGRPHSRRHCVRWGPSSLPGWMDQDSTWHGGGPWSRPLCARWGPSPLPKKGRSPQFLAHVYCGQMAAWIKMPLGTEVGLSLCDIVLGGDPAVPPLKGHSPPIFGQCLRLDGLRCHLVQR